MTPPRRTERSEEGFPGPDGVGTERSTAADASADPVTAGPGTAEEWTCTQCGWTFSGSSEQGMPAEVQAHMDSHRTSVPAAEAEADAGTDANGNADIWEAYDQALAAAVRERDRALDKATTRLASVTAGGYLEYDRSVSLAWAAYESASHNARLAHAAAPR